MNDVRESILAKVRTANLLPAHVALWESVLPNIPDDQVASIKQSIDVRPDNIKLLNVLLIDLSAAARTQNPDAWAQAVKEHFERTQEVQ
jgi:hypothetical protein